MKALNERILMLPNYYCFSVLVKDLFITYVITFFCDFVCLHYYMFMFAFRVTALFSLF